MIFGRHFPRIFLSRIKSSKVRHDGLVSGVSNRTDTRLFGARFSLFSTSDQSPNNEVRSNTSGSSLSNSFWTVPNVLSLARIGSSPVLGFLIVNNSWSWASGLFFVSAATDFVDGYIARNWKGQMSVAGSFLDPFADKVFVMTVASSMAWTGALPWPLAGLVVFRDVGLMVGSLVVRYRALRQRGKLITLTRFFDVHSHDSQVHQVQPTAFSKWNTAFVGALFGTGLVLQTGLLGVDSLGLFPVACHLAFGSTFATGLHYLYLYRSNKIFIKIKK